jgi:hypothetical protein
MLLDVLGGEVASPCPEMLLRGKNEDGEERKLARLEPFFGEVKRVVPATRVKQNLRVVDADGHDEDVHERLVLRLAGSDLISFVKSRSPSRLDHNDYWAALRIPPEQ